MKYISLVFVFLMASCVMYAQQFSLDGEWKFIQGDNKANAAATFNDADWQTVDGSTLWFDKKKLAGAATTSNYIWLRKKVMIPSSLKKELAKTGALALYLGKVQEEDDCYLNGRLIGSTTNGDVKRAYLLPEKEILWDKENTIALRILHWGYGSGIAAKPFIAAAKPEQVFTIKNDQKGTSPKEQVTNKPVVYDCIIQNHSAKAVAANLVASFYNAAGEKLKSVEEKATLQPGENVFHFPFQSLSPFLKIAFTVDIPEYNYTTLWNTELGYQNIMYKAGQPLVGNKTKDAFSPAQLEQQTIKGWLGSRLKANKDERLHKVDETAILAGYINKPGVHPWIGEHVGKFLEAACNTYKNTGDAALKIQIDRTAQQLIASQLSNGYLGTYDSASHWTSWDVWSHKYNLIGLLAYYQLSGYKPALRAAEKIGDLLAATFGTGKAQKDIIKAGTHVGMAATSVLDPMTDLYRFTANKKYLEFCYYITSSYNEKAGPKIIATLDSIGRVDKTANAKAYEMLSNLVGVIKLYRLTGDQEFLTPVLAAWKDITANRLYITGTASTKEHFVDDHVLPAGVKDNMGEGCVTTTWLQFNYQLLGLTGKIEYLDELERSVYNHLTGAENPETGCVSYYTPLMGIKPYGCNITCCLSSVPRGIAMIPQFANGKIGGAPSFLFYQPGIYKTTLDDKTHTNVAFETTTNFPQDGDISITVNPSSTTPFNVLLRKPYWAGDFTVSVNGITQKIRGETMLAINRTWKKGDKIAVHFTMPVKLVDGGISYPGAIAFQRGPQVLVFDKSLNAASADNVVIPDGVQLQKSNTSLPEKWIGTQVYQLAAEVNGKSEPIILVPYADASQTGGLVTTWMKKK